MGASFCQSILIDEQGREKSVQPLQNDAGLLQDALLHLAAEQHIMTPSIVVRRSVYEDLGGFDERLVCAGLSVGQDAALTPSGSAKPLALYRMHRDSNSSHHLRTGENTRYIHLAIDIMESYLPSSVAATLSRRAKKTYARSAFDEALALLKQRDLAGGMAVARAAFRLSRSPGIFLYAARRSARMLFS